MAASTEKDEAEKVVNEQTEKLKKEMEDKIASIRYVYRCIYNTCTYIYIYIYRYLNDNFFFFFAKNM